MTNADIIFTNSQRLAKEGVIKYTGREFKALDSEGKEIVIKETDPIHTFAAWKQMGFRVKKGEHAIAKFPIWKHTERESEDGEKDEKMFMKMAHFFKESQVEAIA